MKEFNKIIFKNNVENHLKTLYRKSIKDASEQQIFQAISYSIKDYIIDLWIATNKEYEKQDVKYVYYLSMEFLMGRVLGNLIMNIKSDKMIQEALDEWGINLNRIEEEEPDPALGNGGLGRLAACFLDSLSTLGYPAYGCGIRYKYGMFKQKIADGYQVEVPDNWLEFGNPFEVKREEYTQEIKFGGSVRMIKDNLGRDKFIQENYQSVFAVPYDIPIVGYGNHVVNTLRIWDAKGKNPFHLDSFDKGEYIQAVKEQNLASTICEVLYPNDNHYAGKELRLKQQYFFVSATIQRAVAKYMEKHEDIRKIHEKVCFQLNDTHPTVAVAELMRILLDNYNLSWEVAWEITRQSCGYTNHTIMAEALEKWPIDLFSKLLPRIYQIIEEIHRRFLLTIESRYPGNTLKVKNMAILYDGEIHMANLAIVGSFSVNGVAKIHTEILKNRELKDFYEMYPEKFNNKTNGITQRRFLLHGNPLLAEWINNIIGDEWIINLPAIGRLADYAKDAEKQKEFMDIKYKNKIRLADYINKHNGIEVNPNSIFDVQIKRIHEYKRQLLNILHVMYLYNQLKKDPFMHFYPRTFIFGGKASIGYKRAKEIIKLINCVADVINHDETIADKIKVVFIENYRVSNAELIFPAADVSEQISTASKEASGTGNMKFMLNGALTLGTLDGANIEILEEVGEENMFLFGLSSKEVMDMEASGTYHPLDIYNQDEELRTVVDQLINGSYSPKNPEAFKDLYHSLLEDNQFQKADPYFILKDFKSYIEVQKKIELAYLDTSNWAKSAILNIAKSGKFSSDRTIEEYATEIWRLKKIK